jgi:ELWxxDGT repeat protein
MSSAIPSRVRTLPASRAIELLEPRTLLAAQLVADLNTAPASSDPEQSVSVNGLTYFVADDGLHGREIWRTDGTPAGTRLVRDIAPGTDSGSPLLLGAAGDRVYFEVYGQLWQTDPLTGASTVYTSDGNYYYGGLSPRSGVALGDDFYAVGQNGLYRIHDGASTRLSDLGSGYIEGIEIVAAGSNLYVLTKNAGLWISDGTAEGTHLVKPVQPSVSQYSADLVALGDTVYFTIENSQNQSYEIWKSQGTDETTSFVFATNAYTLPAPIAAAGDNVYFWNRNPQYFDYDLWKTDGTPEGTSAIVTVPFSGAYYPPPTLLAAGSKVFFPASDYNGNNTRLWTSDGTPEGTTVVRDDLTPFSDRYDKGAMMAGGDAVYFLAFSPPTFDYQVWTTLDGTPATTRYLGSIPDNQALPPSFFGLVDDHPLLAHTDAQHAREPWIVNPTGITGPSLLKDISAGTADANVARPVGVNGRLLVPVDQDLWLFPAPGSAPQRLTVGVGGPRVNRTGAIARVGNQIFLASYVAGVTAPQLLVTDGTPAGTRIVKEITGGNLPFQGFAVGNLFYFNSGYTGAETLNVSDGTTAGTRALMSGFQIANSATRNQRTYATFNGRLYFGVRRTSSAQEDLWSTDGTPAGTAAVTPGTFPSPGQILSFTLVANRLYFLWNNHLYRTDGTASGTVPVGTAMYSRLEPTDDGGLLLLEFNNRPVARLAPGADAPAPLLPDLIAGYASARVGKWTYFVAYRGSTHGIWRTDGTPQNTTLVTTAAQPQDLTPAAGALYFTSTGAGGTGREVWVTDGTPAGTRLVADVAPGEGSSSRGNLVDADGALYFAATDGVHGIELWRATDDVAPAAFNPTFNPAGSTVSIAVPFTENVAASLTLSDFELTDRATGQDVSTLLASVSFDPNTFVATLTLSTTLPKGDYRLTLPAGAAADATGNPTAAATIFDFFHLPGDINRDRTVNFDDLLVLAKNYNKTGVAYTDGDLTGDGVVNFDDLLILAKNYNSVLSPLPAPATIASAVAPLVARTTIARPTPTPVFSTTPVTPKPPPAPAKRPTPPRKTR